MAAITVGIIGLGRMGPIHARGLLAEGDSFVLKSACDVRPEAREAFAKSFPGVEVCADYRRIVDDPAIDAVVNLLPHDLHETVCRQAAQAGKGILLEKPIARTLDEADGIIRAGHEAKVTLMVAHNQRFHPPHIRIRELLDESALGEVFCARTDHYQDFNMPPHMAWWRSRAAVGGGCTIGSGIHRLDLLRWYLGEVDEVFAYQREDPSRLEAEVVSLAVLKFRGGAIAEFFCNWGVHQSPWCEGMSIFGREGSLYLYDALRMHSLRKSEFRNLSPVPVEAGRYESLWAHFARCINTGTKPLTSGEEARASLALALAICRSAESGKPVRLGEDA